MELNTPKCKILIKKCLEEIEKKEPQEWYFSEVERVFPNHPFETYVSIRKIEENGCICKVQCLPFLYEKLRTLENVKTNDFEIQNAYLTCKQFLETVFEGGLSATLITEEKRQIPRETITLLINGVSIRQISDKIDALLNGATGEILIIGWVGTILLKKLRELREKGVEIKVITGNVKTIRQDPMQKEKERAMKELVGIIRKENISIKPEFHGRAIVVDNKALVGSMDLDSYSLTGTRIEFATYTEDPETVRSLRNFFNEIFTPWKKEQKS